MQRRCRCRQPRGARYAALRNAAPLAAQSSLQSLTRLAIRPFWQVLGARERPSAAVLSAYAGLLSSLNDETMKDRVLPALVRHLRRTPDIVLTSLAALPGAAAQLDMGPYAVELLPILIQQLRLKEGVRPLALDTVRHQGVQASVLCRDCLF